MNDVATKAADIAYAVYGREQVAAFTRARELARTVSADDRSDATHVAIAYLAGILKRTTLTREDLLNMGLPREVVNGVTRLQRGFGETFVDYVTRVSEDSNASLVKFHELAQDYLNKEAPYTNRLYRSLDTIHKSIRRNCERSG